MMVPETRKDFVQILGGIGDGLQLRGKHLSIPSRSHICHHNRESRFQANIPDAQKFSVFSNFSLVLLIAYFGFSRNCDGGNSIYDNCKDFVLRILKISFCNTSISTGATRHIWSNITQNWLSSLKQTTLSWGKNKITSSMSWEEE